MKQTSGEPGTSCQLPQPSLLQRSKSTSGQSFVPSSTGRPVVAASCCAWASVNQTVCRERTSPASPCIMCISTWQWTRLDQSRILHRRSLLERPHE
jgi:hypothetical protein